MPIRWLLIAAILITCITACSDRNDTVRNDQTLENEAPSENAVTNEDPALDLTPTPEPAPTPEPTPTPTPTSTPTPVPDMPPVQLPVSDEQVIDMYLLSGQSNANESMLKELDTLLANQYDDENLNYGTAHWYRGGAAIRLWVDTESNTQEYWKLMMAALESEVEELQEKEHQLRSVSLIWVHGEDDAFEGTENYAEYFTRFVENWNQEISRKFGVPAYVSAGLTWAEECHIAWDHAFKLGLPFVRQAQKSVALKFDNVGIWETSDIERSDCLHIDDHQLAMKRALRSVNELQLIGN